MAETSGLSGRLWRAATRTKFADTDLASTGALKRCLTATDLALMGIGGMLGSGVYILTGEIAGKYAGPAALLSFLLAGLVSLLTALLYAECATRVPRTGASYLFTYVGLGEMVAFLVGWNVLAFRVFVVAYSAKGWSAYLDSLVGYKVRNFTVGYVMNGLEWDFPVLVQYPDIVGAIVIVLGTIPVTVGTNLSSKTNAFFVVVNVVIVAMMFVVAMIHADFSYLTVHGFFPMGLSGVIAGAAISLGSGFGGFESILFSAEEAKKPNTGLPLGVFAAHVVTILNYLAGVLAISVLTEYQDINGLSPFVAAFEGIGLGWMGYLVGMGGLFSMTSGVLSTVLCLSRNIFAMARDGLLSACLGRTCERTKTPVVATLVGSALSIPVCVFVDFTVILEFMSLGVLVDFTVVAATAIALRYQGLIRRSEYTEGDGARVVSTDVEMAGHRSSFHDISIISGAGSGLSSPTAAIGETDSTPTPSRQGVISRLPSDVHRWMSNRPKAAVLASFSAHLLFECTCVALVTFKNDELLRADVGVVVGVILSGGLAMVSCWPLLVLPQLGRGAPFQVPLMPWLPLLAVLCNVIFAVQIPLLAWAEITIWLIAGVFVYFFYGMHHSVEGKSR